MSDKRATLEEAENQAREIGRTLKGIMPKGWGFTLILSSYGDNGFSTYISSYNREDMILSLHEMVTKLATGAPEA